MALRRTTVVVAACAFACSAARASAEVLAEAGATRLQVGSIGGSPPWTWGVGNVGNSLQLRGFAPDLRLGASLRPTRRVELRVALLDEENVYSASLPPLGNRPQMAQGGQRVRGKPGGCFPITLAGTTNRRESCSTAAEPP